MEATVSNASHGTPPRRRNGEQRKMVHLARGTGIHHQSGTGTHAFADQMMMHTAQASSAEWHALA